MEKKPPSSPAKITTKPQAGLSLKTSPSNNKSPQVNPKNDKKEGTESSDDDEILDEISVESKIKQLSPTKYFQKRTSCDYMKLKSIEKPMRRASAIDAGLGLGPLKDPNSQAYLVKFSTITEEIKTEENENNKKVLRNDKPKRSILKNTFAEEELVLTKIFEKKSLTELIEKIDKAAFGNPKLYNDLIPKVFLEYWLVNQSNVKKCWLILQGINLDYLRVVFRDGIENKIILSVSNALKVNYQENVEFVLNFLENFTKVRRFKFSLSCLSSKELGEIHALFEDLQKMKNVDAKRLESLRKSYEQ